MARRAALKGRLPADDLHRDLRALSAASREIQRTCPGIDHLSLMTRLRLLHSERFERVFEGSFGPGDGSTRLPISATQHYPPSTQVNPA